VQSSRNGADAELLSEAVAALRELVSRARLASDAEILTEYIAASPLRTVDATVKIFPRSRFLAFRRRVASEDRGSQ
jgi:hypothetical protein